MNKLNVSLVLITFFLPLFLEAQGWEKTYDGGLNEIVFAADRTLDGGIIIAGTQVDEANDLEYSFLYKTDIDGNLQWEFYDTENSASVSWVVEVLSTSDGNYLLSAQYLNQVCLVQKIAPGGTVLWEKWMSTIPVLDYITDLAETADGDYLLMGNYKRPADFDYTVGLVKVDADGSVLWEKEFETLYGFNYSSTTDILVTANGDILIAGRKQITLGADIDVFVKRLDHNGNIIWETLYEDDFPDIVRKVIELASGDFVIGGLATEITNETIIALRKIDASGNEVWYQNYDFGNNQLHGLEKTADGGFVLAGETEWYSPGWTDFYLMKVDSSGNLLWTKNYGRSKDDSYGGLIPADDEGFYLAGYTQKQDDSHDAYLVKTDSLGNSFPNELNGNLYFDENFDCLLDTNEFGLQQWLIEAEKDDAHYFTLTDSEGNYTFSLDTGIYEITAFTLSPYWAFCDSTFDVSINNLFDTIEQHIPVQAIIDCPLLDVSIGTPFLRRCFENTYYVNYCNYGTAVAEDASIEITLDPAMEVTNTSIPIEDQMGDVFTFDLGDISVGECGSFTIDLLLGDTLTNCDSILIGQTHCVEAHIYPDSICLPINNWSGASIEVDAVCLEDSITFFIQNVGSAPTQPNLQYFVIEDDVILYEGTFSLDEGGTETITVLTNGSTFRLEAEQEPNHPGMSMPSISVEGCGDENLIFTFGFVNIFAQDDGDPFVDIDCRPNIGAFDPNDKMGFPIGLGTEYNIRRGQDIEYLIRFQNTGTDTAFNVVIRDELSEYLDLASVRPGAASHPYKFDVATNGELIFTFENIMLPDSNVNEINSHGFVKFKVAQQSNLDFGTQIYNSAAIFFDFNAPVITNETLHTISENIFSVSIDPVNIPQISVKVYPNPFNNFTNIEIEGLEIKNGVFMLYDVTGRLLRREHFYSNNFVLQKKNLQTGLYFFTIENENLIIANGKIISQ